MKNRNLLSILFVAAMLLTLTGVQAQTIEITPVANFHYGGSFQVREGKLKAPSAASYGGFLTVKNFETIIEAMWVRQDTELVIERNLGPTEELAEMAVEYFTLGAGREFGTFPVMPFVIGGVGAAVFTPKDSEFSSETKMAVTFTGGLKYYFSERVGIRIQAQLLMPIQWGGGGIFCGTGGCGGTIGGGTAIAQGTVGGGLIIALGDSQSY